jgi:ABC-type nitrate/sulfonate/bicarbonate transport system substrate-binding protein
MSTSAISRRKIILSALAAAPAILSGRANTQDRRKITFTLPWLAEGSNAFVFVAKAKGYWDELGLDVQITRGYGSVAAAQAIGAGQFQFGAAAASAGIQQAAKGLPVTAIACAGYDATMGICVLKDSPIKTPTDLVGKKMGSAVASGEYPFLPLFAQKAGFDFKSVELSAVDPNVRQRLLVTGQVDAISGFAISFVPPLVSQKIDLRAMLFSQYGLTLYNNSLMTQLATLRNERKLCEDITSGICQAIKFTMLNPEEAAQLFLKLVPETALTPSGVEQTRLGIGIFSVSMLREAALKNCVGYAVPEDYQTMTDLVMKYVASTDDKPPTQSDIFTNDLVGKVKFTADEWKTAEAKAEPFRKYLG